MAYINDIRRALKEIMQKDDKTILLGEDICDPFGGCFKVTRGFTGLFPNRVINTPISEACIIGVGTGLAMSGYIPIIEIMFYDFMTLCMDQLVNHALIFNKIWDDIRVPMLIRTVVGKPEYGISHSKNLDFIFNNILELYHPDQKDVYNQLLAAFNNAKNFGEPVLFVEESKWY